MGDIPSYLENTSEARDTFVQTAADYTALIYIMGVGDRHIDNIMLQPDGQLFHIDFGYIFGKDTSINFFPPRMTLARSIISAMGGASGKQFARFKKRLCKTLRKLSRHSEELLQLFDDTSGKQYSEGRAFVEKRLCEVHDARTLETLISEAWNSRWARFQNFMVIRSCHRKRVHALVFAILCVILLLILIVASIRECISRRKARKRESEEDESPDLEAGV